MTTKALIEAALKLPARSRARLADQLLDSLDESVWEEALVEGSKTAERRLRAMLAGKTKAVPEEEAHRMLFGKR